MTFRAGIVMRVSSDQQDPENQRARIEAFIQSRPDISPVEWYIFKESAFKKDRKDPEWLRMWKDAERHHIDLVLVLRMDRFSRNTVVGQLVELDRLERAGAKFVSIDEPFLSTDSELAAPLRALCAWVARKESEDKSKRVKEAYNNRKGEWGRPKGSGRWSEITAEEIARVSEELEGEGREPSLRNIASKLEKWDVEKGRHIRPSPQTILRCSKKAEAKIERGIVSKRSVPRREELLEQEKGG